MRPELQGIRVPQRKLAVLFIMLAMTLAGCGSSPPPEPVNLEEEPAVSSEESAPKYEVLADKLQSPWAIDFDGEETVYISERDGAIVRVKDGAVVRQKLHLAKSVKQEGEGGLLGFALARDFASSKRAFIYHTYEENGQLYNRVVAIRENGDGNSWDEEKALLERIPGAPVHDGGRLAIGPDGNLYITTGDSQREELAQDKTSLAGKILRMRQDGTIPKDNPFGDSYIYSYGHRNPQGLAWNEQGELYSSEHGPSGAPGGHDELNRILPGYNYGWPDVIGDETGQGMTPPVYHTGEDTLAPSGMTANSRGEWLVTGLRGESLLLFTPDLSNHRVLVKSEGRLRDVKIHGGAIYVITNNTDGRGSPGSRDDRLLRIQPPL
jgi:glucose/arabinose dehydrogenase